MNDAARHARGEYVLFLHADTLPPPDFTDIIARQFKPGVAAGAFRFALRDPITLQGLIVSLTRLRGSLLGKPYGECL
jgi:cellulose synthase/poly-beta-1,6-N-acetylglucosamine synthase-like glycosyltransferase